MLTADERAEAIRRALGHVENRYVERKIKEALERGWPEAVKAAYKECRWWGCRGPKLLSVEGADKGLQVEASDGRTGLVRWSEVVAHVAGGGEQLSLLA